MAILNVTVGNVGQSGTLPQIIYIETNNTLAEITTAGFLNGIVSQGIPLSESMAALVSSKTAPNALASSVGWYDISKSGDSWSLSASSIPDGSITAAKLAADSVITSKILDANVTTAKIAANAVTSAKLALTTIQYATVAITAAEFNGMYAAPKLLVAAGGANTLILLDKLGLVMTYGGAAFAAGGVAAVQYDSTINGAGVIASTTLSAATFQSTASTSYTMNAGVVGYPFTTTENKGLYLSNITGAFTTGSSNMVAHLWYKVIATA